MNEQTQEQTTDTKLQKLTVIAPSFPPEEVHKIEAEIREKGGSKWERPSEEKIEEARKKYATHEPQLTKQF